MNRRTFLSAVVVAPVIAALASCGDPDQVQVSSTTPDTTPGTTPGTVARAAIAHPTGADDVVLEISSEGGLIPVGYTFLNPPSLLVSGDGRVFTQGMTPMIYPGPLLPSVLVRSITEDGIQALLGIVQRAGLLTAPPDYTGGDNIADAPNTVVTINADGGTFVHNAYALGISDPETGARKTLLDATTALTDVETAAGKMNLGADGPSVPTAYRFQARVVDQSELTTNDLPPTIVDWPSASGVSLASASDCARVDAAAVGTLFLDAKQNTFFKEGNVVYQLAVAGVMPGDPAC